MINLIDENKWNEAKTLWLIDICKLKPIKDTIDCFGSVFEFFLNT